METIGAGRPAPLRSRPAGALPGANEVTDNLAVTPNRLDQVDSIGEYYAVSVPEPATVSLFVLGVLGVWARRRAS